MLTYKTVIFIIFAHVYIFVIGHIGLKVLISLHNNRKQIKYCNLFHVLINSV